MTVKNPIDFLVLIFLLLSNGCVAMDKKVPADAAAFLDIAISALDMENVSCVADEFSTEDSQILKVLRGHDFDVISYRYEEEDGEIIHQFVLKNKDSNLLLSADVATVEGKCSSYIFARIAQEP